MCTSHSVWKHKNNNSALFLWNIFLPLFAGPCLACRSAADSALAATAAATSLAAAPLSSEWVLFTTLVLGTDDCAPAAPPTLPVPARDSQEARGTWIIVWVAVSWMHISMCPPSALISHFYYPLLWQNQLEKDRAPRNPTPNQFNLCRLPNFIAAHK